MCTTNYPRDSVKAQSGRLAERPLCSPSFLSQTLSITNLLSDAFTLTMDSAVHALKISNNKLTTSLVVLRPRADA